MPRPRKPWKPPVTAVTPTPERKAKAPFGWIIRIHPGEQVSYEAKTVLATSTVRKQLTDDQVKALEDFADLAAKALRNVVICMRTYSGMPYAGMADVIGHMPTSQREAFHEFIETSALMLDRSFVQTLYVMVLGVTRERDGKQMSLEEFGATLVKWRHKEAWKGAAAQAIKDAAIVLQSARKRFIKGERASDRSREAVRAAFEHGRQVERYATQEEIAHKRRLMDEVETFFKIKRIGVQQEGVL